MADDRRGRGSLTLPLDRARIILLIGEAVAAGCRQSQACGVINVGERTLQRWQESPIDGRHGPLTAPANKLTASERAVIVKTSTSTEFVEMSPHQIVPKLADIGVYLASESTFYRILRAEKLNAHRGQCKPRLVVRPEPFVATKPNQLYSWDITYLQAAIRGDFYYLYLFLDIFSRKIVGWNIHHTQEAEYASQLLSEICINEKINKLQITLHADNGGPMKGATMLATMQRLGVMPSFSRPSVSDDNPYSESTFKTLKYCTFFPTKPFDSIEDAIAWVTKFVIWYNTGHLHSGINFVTPESKHRGLDAEILKNRSEVYESAKLKNPNRWSGKTRNWKPITSVNLNPLKEKDKSGTKEELQLAS